MIVKFEDIPNGSLFWSVRSLNPLWTRRLYKKEDNVLYVIMSWSEERESWDFLQYISNGPKAVYNTLGEFLIHAYLETPATSDYTRHSRAVEQAQLHLDQVLPHTEQSISGGLVRQLLGTLAVLR